MDLRLERAQYKPNSTIGRLYVDGRLECYTLEDGIRTHKVYGETAIPPGRYAVAVTYSPHFRRNLPLVCDVPGFEGVRIHPGNKPADTLGCILVGRHWNEGEESIAASRVAFDALFPKIRAALKDEDSVILNVMQKNAPAELAARSSKPRSRKTGVRTSSKRKRMGSQRR